MKKILFTAIAFALVLTSCKPEIKGELGEPFDKVKGLSGNWELGGFAQRDENNPIKEVRDLSDFYIDGISAPTKFNFNSGDMTYTITPGPGKNFLSLNGNWRFDNPDFPTELILESTTDTLTLKLGTVPREFDQTIKMELPRFCVDDLGVASPTVTYIYTLNRAQ